MKKKYFLLTMSLIMLFTSCSSAQVVLEDNSWDNYQVDSSTSTTSDIQTFDYSYIKYFPDAEVAISSFKSKNKSLNKYNNYFDLETYILDDTTNDTNINCSEYTYADDAYINTNKTKKQSIKKVLANTQEKIYVPTQIVDRSKESDSENHQYNFGYSISFYQYEYNNKNYQNYKLYAYSYYLEENYPEIGGFSLQEGLYGTSIKCYNKNVPLTKEFANESLPSIKANLTSNDITSFDNLKEEVHYEIYYAGKYETKDGETFHWGYYYYVNYYFENTNYVYIISNQYRYLTPNALF